MKKSKACFFVLCSQNYAAKALPINFNTTPSPPPPPPLKEKKIPTQIKLPKKIFAKFSYPKKPGIENFKPQKILWSSPSLEIPSNPRPPSQGAQYVIIVTK